MNTLQEYKCPCCDGGIEFDASSQKLKCPYCGTEFDVETLISYDNDLHGDTQDDMKWDDEEHSTWHGEEEGLSSYVCNSCGGEIVGDDTMAASNCPYCNSPIVIMGKFKGTLKPDYVIPFKLDKKAAIEALKNYYKGKTLLPKIFKDENRIREVKGVYVPFWLFDTKAQANMRYRATTNRMWSDSKYDYIETCFYSVTRKGELCFENVPVDGSVKMDDALMESLEPFDFTGAVDFQTAYLAGYFADKFDVDATESIHRANERIKLSTEEVFEETVRGYSSVNTVSSSVKFENGKSKYSLCPVWLLNSEYKGEKYTFAVNGQTGKTVGNLPMDKAVYTRYFLGVLGASFAIVLGLCKLFGIM